MSKINLSKIEKNLIFFISIFLIQSRIIFNINFSFSDIFLITFLLLSLLTQKLTIPRRPFYYAFLLTIHLLITSFFVTPSKFNVVVDYQSVIVNFFKLFVGFSYFISGYLVAKLGWLEQSISYYSKASFLVALSSVLLFAFGIRLPSWYFGGVRLRGLMVDPNYFSVVLMSSYPFFHFSIESRIKKIFIFFVYLIAILLTGSKTGMMTLLFTGALIIYTNYTKKKNLYFYGKVAAISLIFFILLQSPSVKNISLLIIEKAIEKIPIMSRIMDLFYDIEVGITSGGSGRDTTWLNGLRLIKMSPMMGVGIGTYTTLTRNFFESSALAHNTYIQVLSEWGLVFGIVFFIKVFYLIIKNYKKKKIEQITASILLILMFGSLAISLNNARMLWFYLGSIYLLERGEF